MKHVIKWHRYFGIVIGLFVVVLAITGILLNHSDELELSRRHTSNPLLMKLYGIPQPRLASVFKTADHRLLVGGESVVLDGKATAIEPPARGLVEANGILLVASGSGIILRSLEGELIDTIAAPTTVAAIGVANGKVFAKAGNTLLQMDDDMTALAAAPSRVREDIAWSRSEQLSSDELASLSRALPRPGLPVERVILDLHSGRLFGYAGVILFDLVAVAMLGLVGSGLWVWLWRRGRRTSRKRRR